MKIESIANVLLYPFYDFITCPGAEMNLYSTLERGPNRGAVSADNTCTAPTITKCLVSGTETY